MRMSLWIELLLATIGVTVVNCFLFFDPKKKQKETYHHVKVKFVGGNKTKLVLNETQYASFKEWLNRPDGYYEIQDDGAFVYLDRQYVAAVEMRKR